MADLNDTQAIIGQHCLAIMDTIQDDAAGQALLTFFDVTRDTAEALIKAGHSPESAAGLMAAAVLIPWRMETRDDG